MGRKKIDVNISEIERLSGLGLTQEEMCAHLGISVDTLENRIKESSDYSDAIKRGKAAAAEQVSDRLFDLCMRGNLGAIIWYEKTRRGLSDRLNVSGDIDQRIESELAKLAAARQAEVLGASTAGE